MATKTVAVFGATGRSGKPFVPRALAAGHRVRALARTPSKMTPPKHAQLTVIEGDVLDPKTVEQVVQGADVVVSLLGHAKGSPPDVQTRGTQNILSAMKKHGVGRIVSLTGGGVPYERDQPGFPDKLIRFIMKIVAKDVLNDGVNHAAAIRSSGLDYVIVRGPRLTEGEEKGSYKIGYVGTTGGTSISRADLADFLLKVVNDQQYDGTMPFVSY